jgi:hypothetical protein
MSVHDLWFAGELDFSKAMSGRYERLGLSNGGNVIGFTIGAKRCNRLRFSHRSTGKQLIFKRNAMHFFIAENDRR